MARGYTQPQQIRAFTGCVCGGRQQLRRQLADVRRRVRIGERLNLSGVGRRDGLDAPQPTPVSHPDFIPNSNNKYLAITRW